MKVWAGSDFKEPEWSVAAGAALFEGLEGVGLLRGRDEGASVTGVRRTVGEQLGDTFSPPLPAITFTLLVLLLLLLLLLCPFSSMELLGGDSLRSQLLSESFRHIS